MGKKRDRQADAKRNGRSAEFPVEYSEAEIHKAFRRMAFLLANLVCGIWLILLIASATLDERGPGLGPTLLVALASVPVAYLIPYGLVRAIGRLVVMWRKARARRQTGG